MYIKTFNKPYKKNLINIYVHKRFMMSGIFKTSSRMINQNLQNITNTRAYAGFAGKSKLGTKFINKEETVINSHQQYITDFSIIYENPNDIQLYQIGTLFTNPNKNSYNVSNEKNYKFEDKTQQIKFFDKVIPVNANVHIVKNSMKYFDNSEIKQNVENNDTYKKLFNQVLEELKAKGIKYKIAETSEDFQQTGFNILKNLNPTLEKNSLLETLHLKNDSENK